MFEPLLFHLFFLYSSLSLIAGLVNYARCLALGKIFLVCFFLLVETVCHLYVFIQTSKTENSHTAPSLLPLHMMVLLSSLGVSSLENVMKTVREKQEAGSEASQPSGMPPSYIVVKSAWISEDDQLEQPQAGCSHSFKVIKVEIIIIVIKHFLIIFIKQTNPTSLQVLFFKWKYLVKVRRELLHVEFPFPPVIVITDRKRFTKMMRIISSTEESWRMLANNSEGFLFLNLTNMLLVILFCMRARSYSGKGRSRTQELSTLKMIKCDPA